MRPILDRFAGVIDKKDYETLTDVHEFADWLRGRRDSEFNPRETDDVDIRTFLLSQKIKGAASPILKRKTNSLERFYDWAHGQGLLGESPFERFSFDPTPFDDGQIRRRENTLGDSPEARELARLRALNRLAESLNRSSDLKSTLDAALNAIVDVMELRTAWLSLWKKHIVPTFAGAQDTSHDFVLAGCCNLPPGLEQENRLFLRRPPKCRCQRLLSQDRLVGAVNMVMCSRLQDAAEASGDTKGLKYHATCPIMSNDRPLGLINVASENWKFFEEDDLKLLSLASEMVAGAIERADLFDRTENQRVTMTKELDAARNVQASFMPRNLPQINGVSLAAEWRSVLRIAGDFYDIFPVADNRWGIVIADVSGKGTASGLYSARVRTLIQEISRRNRGPSATLAEINHLLMVQSSDGMFVTTFFAILDPAAHTLTYANAGHDWPFISSTSGNIERLPSNGPLMGVFEDAVFGEDTVELGSGDALIAFTDGATDALNPEGEQYGESRLEAAIKAALRPSNAAAWKKHLLDDLAGFTQGAPQEDDITLFVVSCCAE